MNIGLRAFFVIADSLQRKVSNDLGLKCACNQALNLLKALDSDALLLGRFETEVAAHNAFARGNCANK